MKQQHSMVVICLVILIGLSITTDRLTSAQEDVFQEDFESTDLPGWDLIPPVEISEGTLNLGPGGAAQAPITIHDGEITLRLRRGLDGGILGIRYRQTERGGYLLRLQESRITLIKENAGEEAVLAEEAMEFPASAWVTLFISLQNSEHLVTITEINLTLTASDPEPLEVGGVLFFTEGGMEAQLDDLEVRSGPAPLTETEPDQEAAVPAVQPGSLPDYQNLVWQRLGGPPGGLGYDIRMRPDQPDIMFVTDAHAGIHKSIDGGMTWMPVNEGIATFSGGIFPVFSATIDPHDYDTIWVGTQFTGQIYRSTDGGQTWEERDQGLTQEGCSVRGITIDPNNPEVVYAGVEIASAAWAGENIFKRFDLVQGEVYKSENAGQSWNRIWVGDNLARYIWIDPRDSERLYVTTGIFDRDAANSDVPNRIWGGVGILRSEDGGSTWTILDERNGLGGRYVPSLFMHPEDPDVLLAAVTGTGDQAGAYLTRDGGDTWELILPRPPGFGSEAVEISESNPDVWYVAGESQIWRSDDAGKNWQQFPMRTSDRPAGLPIDLQVDPRDPWRIFVNNYGGGNFLSEDGGETWVEASQGYTGLGVYSLIVDPVFPGTVMARNFVSQDAGITWVPYPIPEFEVYAVWPDGEGEFPRLIAGAEDFWSGHIGTSDWTMTQLVDLPAERKAGRIEDERMKIVSLGAAPWDDQLLFAGFAHALCAQGIWEQCLDVPTPGLFRSRDGGSHWERMDNTPWHPLGSLCMDFDPSDEGTVYVGTTAGLYLSQNKGESWTLLVGLDAVTNQVPVIDWSVIPTGLKSPIVYDVCLDPFDTSTIYAAATPGGIYRSNDGGESWIQAAAGMNPNEPVYVIIPDPFRPDVLYASSSVSGVFVTTNGGDSWTRMSEGLFISNIRGLSLSGDGRHLYAGSLGGGVFRLDLYGDPPQVLERPAEEAVTSSESADSSSTEQPATQPAAVPEYKSGWKPPCPGAALPLAAVGAVLWFRSRREG